MAQDTVTVACKMPAGLLLRTFAETTTQEPVPGGGYRDVKVFVHTGEIVKINGYAAETGKSPKAMMTEEGYALTSGVSREFWETWVAQNQDLDALKNGLIFAHGALNSVYSQSRDHDKTRNGLEPMDQKGDLRIPKSPRLGAEIEPASKA
jgi:hypothetical protein